MQSDTIRGSMQGAAQEASKSNPRRERFLKNILWSWTGVVVSIVSGLCLAPYIIRKLGNEAYGVWALMFSVLEYYWLLDLGMRSATFRYSGHYRATNEDDKVNEVINTGLAYSSITALLMAVGSILLAGPATRFFQISPAYQAEFRLLVMMVGSAWAVGTTFSLLSAVVEGYQRFDLTSRTWILSTAIRTAGLIVALALGYRLKAMAAAAIFSLIAGYVFNYRNAREVFPALRFSLSRVRRKMFRRMLGYGIHTCVATIANQLLTMAGPLLVGHFLPTAFVGYFLLPAKLLRYAVDMVCKVGYVTGSNAAEMAAKGEHDALYRMGLYVNRYCYALFAPLALAFCLYGTELLRVWINPEFAMHSAGIIPAAAVSTTLGIAAQFNSSSILYGLSKHRGYAYSLLAEGILNSAAMYFAIPKYGISGAAWITAGFMILNRGLVTSLLFCHGVERSVWPYLLGVYLRPTLAAAPVLAASWWLKAHWLPGVDWIQVLAGMGLLGAGYYALAFFICLDPKHRMIPWRWVQAHVLPAQAA